MSLPRIVRDGRPVLLDLFCGLGGWSKAFARKGWRCVGVDINALGYPYEFIAADCLTLCRDWIDQFDGVCASPPCEDFARAWLPWLRGDHKPQQWAIDLLKWSVAICDRPGRITECSRFAARHVPGADIRQSYALWGDVPLLIPEIPRCKARKSGMRSDLRAEIPDVLAAAVEAHFSAGIKARARAIA